MRKRLYIFGIVIFCGALVAAAVFVFSGEGMLYAAKAQLINTPSRWTQDNGVAISVPACVSSGSTGSPVTCQNGSPIVQFSFSGLEMHLETIRLQIFQNGSLVTEQILCGVSGSNALTGSCPASSYLWTGGVSDRSYTWRLIHAYAGQVVPETNSGGSGAFSTPNCNSSQLPDLVPGNPSVQ